ncbi:hypothetical protein QO200_09835 [Flavobacterium sp. Arc3]|uniref:hypothetical protein n=1 Tax=Flavobacterium sp. Arc3 TaxID=3046686 RepID=UPI00352EB173
MKAIQHTKKIIKNSIHLFYSICTNDLIVYSKQASNIEIFVLAFFIECNRLFIADSVFMNAVQKHLLVKIRTFLASNNNIQSSILVEIKNATFEMFNGSKLIDSFHIKENIANQQ